MIQFTQGDAAVLQLQATDGGGNPVDLTGATFTTYVKGETGVIATFPNSQHLIEDASNGDFSLTLSPSDTAQCGVGPGKEILTKVVIGGSPVFFRGVNILEVFPPVPVQ